LSSEAMGFLEEMGISLDENVPYIKYFKLFSVRSKAGFTFPSMGRGISRYKLDEDLLRNAENAGVHVFRGICMRRYKKNDQNIFQVETNADDFYARNLFIATGKHDHSKEHKRKGKDDSYIGFKTHLHFTSLSQGFEETTVLFTFPGGYGGICPVENNRINFCFAIDRLRYKALNSNFEEAVAFLRRSNPQLDLILEQANFTEPVCAVGFIPYGYLRESNSDENIYFLGDQRAVIPSFTGDGMAIALSTAKSSVDEFESRQKGRKAQVEPIQKILKKQMRWALMTHTLLKFPWAIELCLVIPGYSSFWIQTIFLKTRISKMKDKTAHEPTHFKNNYSRC